MNLNTLDKWFSRYIRLRDSNNGAIKCCSCGRFVAIYKADAGHFVNRKHMSLRYSEINVNSQCISCNRFDEGNIPAYSLFMQKKYGSNIIEKLLIQKNQTVKYSQADINEMVKYYKKLVKELEVEKNYKFDK